VLTDSLGQHSSRSRCDQIKRRTGEKRTEKREFSGSLFPLPSLAHPPVINHSLRTRFTERGGENQPRAETAEHAERSSRSWRERAKRGRGNDEIQNSSTLMIWVVLEFRIPSFPRAPAPWAGVPPPPVREFQPDLPAPFLLGGLGDLRARSVLSASSGQIGLRSSGRANPSRL
jgi:hypothetical protein